MNSKSHLKHISGNPSLHQKAPCKISDSFCEPSALLSAAVLGTVARESRQGETTPTLGKLPARKPPLFFFFMSPGSCLRTLDLCQNKIVHPSPKRAAWLGRFLVLPDQQKGRKNGRINRNTANSYHLICSLSLLQAHTDPLALSNLTQTYTLACTRSLLFGSQYGGHCFIPSVTFKCPINCQLEKCPIVFHPENPHPSQIQALRAHFEYVFNFWIQTGELFMPWLLYDLS